MPTITASAPLNSCICMPVTRLVSTSLHTWFKFNILATKKEGSNGLERVAGRQGGAGTGVWDADGPQAAALLQPPGHSAAGAVR